MINAVPSTPSQNPMSTPPRSFDDVVSQLQDNTPTAPAMPSATPSAGKPKKKMKLQWILAAIAGVILLVGGGTGAYLLSQNTDNRQKATGTDQTATLSAQQKGYLDEISCNTIAGWTCDGGNYSAALPVSIYYDSVDANHLIQQVTANGSRPDLNGASGQFCGGTTNHGFSFTVPAGSIPAGPHTIIVQSWGIDPSTGAPSASQAFALQPAFASVNPNISCGGSSTTVTNTSNGACTVKFTATVPASNVSCTKVTYRDELNNSAGHYTLNQQQTTFQPGDVVVFTVQAQNGSTQSTTISLSDPLKNNNLDSLQFLDSDCGDNAYNSSTKTLTCSAANVAANGKTSFTFRMKIPSNATNGTLIVNNGTVNAGSAAASCTANITVSTTPTSPTPTPTTYSCNSTCTSDAQCQTVNGSYKCYDTGNGSFCRLNTNPSSASCSVIGCNQACVTNSDCASSDQVCYNTGNGYKCRLQNNLTSDVCGQPVASATPTPAVTPTAQPVKPSTLPKTGAIDDTLKFLMIGSATVILGAFGLLLL